MSSSLRPKPRIRHSWWLVLGLLLLAPVGAEYLSAYDDSTGDPATLIGNLLIFVPLYGCSALLIREVVRRARLGWTGMLLLATAFGLVQAGLVDQSLFSPDYRGIDGWEATYQHTLVPVLGLSVINLINFVGGHVMLSIGGPIALVEAWSPQRATTPWLPMPGLMITAGVYVAGSVAVLRWHLQTEDWHASVDQLVGTAVVVLALVGLAFVVGRRAGRPRRASGPGLPVTAVVALVLAAAYTMLPQNWWGVLGSTALLVIAGVVVRRASGTRRWGSAHVALAAAAPLLLTAGLAFTYDPLVGDVTAPAKYAHNIVMLAIVLGVLGVGLTRRRHAQPQVRDDATLPRPAG